MKHQGSSGPTTKKTMCVFPYLYIYNNECQVKIFRPPDLFKSSYQELYSNIYKIIVFKLNCDF